jgi:hypothetical protein
MDFPQLLGIIGDDRTLSAEMARGSWGEPRLCPGGEGRLSAPCQIRARLVSSLKPESWGSCSNSPLILGAVVVITARVGHLIGVTVASVGLALMVSAQPSVTFHSESELRLMDALELREEALNACEHLVFVAELLSRSERLGHSHDGSRLAMEAQELRGYLSRIGQVALGADHSEYTRWYAKMTSAQTWVECDQRVVRY